MSSVTIDDVRKFLNNLPEEFVGPDAIEIQLTFAEWIVEKERSSSASVTDIYMTVLVHAGCFVTLAYMEEAERALGVIPPNLEELARNLEIILEKALGYIKRGAPVTLKYYTTSASVWDSASGGISSLEDTVYDLS